MTIAAIRSLLESKLSTFALAQSPVLDVAWENRKYEPAATPAMYLRCYLLPATPQAAGLGTTAQDYIRGIFQIDIMALPQTMTSPATAIADKLRTHFKRGTRLVGAGAYAGTEVACESVGVMPAMMEDTRYKVSVDITFYAYMNPA